MTEGPENAPARLPGPSAVRSLIRRAGEAVGAARALLEADQHAQQAVRDTYGSLHAEVMRERLAEVPVERLKEIVPRLPAARLEKAGFADVGAVLDAGTAQLTQIRGVGRHSAARAVAAAQRMAEAVGQDVRITADVDMGDERAAALLGALHRVRTTQSAVDRAREPARRIGGQFGRLMSGARRKSETAASSEGLASVRRDNLIAADEDDSAGRQRQNRKRVRPPGSVAKVTIAERGSMR